jgi:choline dehydrogenase
MAEGYDFIIIGGGSAGSVLAARLTENPTVRVCLLEAGGRDWNPLFHLPAGFAKMTKGVASWGWSTVPQRHMGGKVFTYTQAKVIGGGSAINAQIYTRGNAQDYDEWRQLGCEGWSYSDVLPYFRKSEDNDTFDNEYHGKGGPLGVSQPAAPLPICEAYFEAAAALGIPRNMDVNGETQDGAAFYQLTQRNARRSSAAMAYLGPNRGRANLTIKYGAQVRRIDVANGRATGVTLIDGTRLEAEAEVLLCSGAIGSPRLLQLSGIGPADHLTGAWVSTWCSTNPMSARTCRITSTSTASARSRGRIPMTATPSCTSRRWPGCNTLHAHGAGGLQPLRNRRVLVCRPGRAVARLQFHLGLGTGSRRASRRCRDGGVTLNSCYLRPRSRGTVRLASADPSRAPLIDPNYCADPRDREMSIRGLKLTQEILAQEPLKPFIKAERLPGPDVKTDDEYFAFICEHSKTSHHCAGTCRMGVDEGAVVDPRLRFNGIEGLRVIDNSIMPTVISSNTNAAAIMIGEKASDMIKAEHGG